MPQYEALFIVTPSFDESEMAELTRKSSLLPSKNEIKNITKNEKYPMKPFPDLISKIIEAGGLFKYKP